MTRRLVLLLLVLCCLGGAAAQTKPQPGKAAKNPPVVRGAKVGGVYDGSVEIWTSPFIKQAAGEFNRGKPTGVWTFWDDDGTKIVEITYIDGMFSGGVTMWNPVASGPLSKGKLKFRGAFIDGDWCGSAVSYYADGKVRSERVYQGGVISEAFVTDIQGKALPPEEARKVADEDERIDNAFVDAIDAYICRWVK